MMQTGILDNSVWLVRASSRPACLEVPARTILTLKCKIMYMQRVKNENPLGCFVNDPTSVKLSQGFPSEKVRFIYKYIYT